MDALVLETVRTPRAKAKPGGGLNSLTALDLVVTLMSELERRSDLDPGKVDDVVLEAGVRGARRGVVAISGAAGLGVATVVERDPAWRA